MLIDSSASARCSPHFEMLPIIISRYRACSLSMRSQLRAESDGACRRIFSGWCSDASVSEESESSRSFQTPQPMAASPRFWRDVNVRTNHENRGDRLSDQGLNGRINSKPTPIQSGTMFASQWILAVGIPPASCISWAYSPTMTRSTNPSITPVKQEFFDRANVDA